ncbi:MAG: hypothetical protein H0V17_26735 [Deltaproteobacteria bacterium]|nr:hypothetical protein [Deltaproteobacteria bacterium]
MLRALCVVLMGCAASTKPPATAPIAEPPAPILAGAPMPPMPAPPCEGPNCTPAPRCEGIDCPAPTAAPVCPKDAKDGERDPGCASSKPILELR